MGTIVPPNKFVSFLQLHVRQIQFKVGIHTKEALDEYLTENVGYDFGVEKVAFIPSETHRRIANDLQIANIANDMGQAVFTPSETCTAYENLEHFYSRS